MNMIDPTKIKQEELPLFVLSDDRRSFIGWGIKNHSRGSYNHAMMMIRPGYFASQDFAGYREVPVIKYMKPSIILKFWQYEDLPQEIRQEIIQDAIKGLKAPWYRRMYDFLGIIGQLIPGRWTRRLNIPWANYCSERMRRAIKLMRKILLEFIFLDVHPSPTDINRYFKTEPKMRVYGRYLSTND